MAAPAHVGAPPSSLAGHAEALAAVKAPDAAAADDDEGDEGGVWDSASLYEEILDEVEAFEYSADGA